MRTMNRRVATLGKQLAAAAGLRVRRLRPENRFDAMADGLRLLASSGYHPKVVIDAGANNGQWATLAQGIFPTAQFNLVEPQPRCVELLRGWASPLLQIHQVVVTKPGVSRASLAGVGTSGAWVVGQIAPPASDVVVEYEATTLDALFAAKVKPTDRVLLKMDLEGHEPEALTGATSLLREVEVVVTETSFVDYNNVGFIHFDAVSQHLRHAGFVLFDVVSLKGRRRDQRLMMGDVIFVRQDSPLARDANWD